MALLLLLGCEDIHRAEVVVAGGAHSCALTSLDEVLCWGGSDGAEPQFLHDLPSITALAAGLGHTCGIDTRGQVWCWGAGQRGQLGHGETTSSADQVRVEALGPASAIALGDLHSCAVLSEDGSVACWGANAAGQLGDGTMDDAPEPVTVAGLTEVVDVAAGGVDAQSHTCALHADATVSCWGRGVEGQLGDGIETSSSSPVPSPGLRDVTSLSLGALHSCATGSDGTATCWGLIEQEDLTALDGLDITAISAGDLHTCVLTSGGEVHCFGDDFNGQLGDGPVDNTGGLAVPIVGATSISAGSLHSCAALSEGSVACWGENNNGRIGDGEVGGQRDKPVFALSFGL